VGQWALKISNVANNAFPPDGLTTDFADDAIVPVLNDGEIRVWNLHTLTWSKNANGNWTETGSWTATPGGYLAHSPNITVNAVIDTPYQVNLNGTGAANSIMVSSGDLEVSGSLQATTGLTVQSNGIVNLAAGSTLTSPSVTVTTGGQLTVPSLTANSLTVLSGGLVTISGLSAGSALSNPLTAPVPEPSTLLMLITLMISGAALRALFPFLSKK